MLTLPPNDGGHMTRFDVETLLPRAPALALACAAALFVGCGTHTFEPLDDSGSTPLSVDDVPGKRSDLCVLRALASRLCHGYGALVVRDHE